MKSTPAMHRRFARAAVLSAFAGLLASCGTVELSGDTLHRVDKALESRKKPSLRTWQEDQGEGGRAKLLKLAELQTGLLLRWDTVSITSEPTNRHSVNWTVSMHGKAGSIASAVPLTRDGYFLTAAHCVERGPMTLVIATRDRKMTKKPVRVVWKGNMDARGPDLAVIHADLEPLLPFHGADAATLSPGDEVAITGWSGLSEGTPNGGTAAGRVISVSDLKHDRTGAAWRTIRHDVPLNSGDSGGPLFTPGGLCLGINAKVEVGPAGLLGTRFGFASNTDKPLGGYVGESVAPEPEWLRGVIEGDREAKH